MRCCASQLHHNSFVFVPGAPICIWPPEEHWVTGRAGAGGACECAEGPPAGDPPLVPRNSGSDLDMMSSVSC